MPKIVDGTIWWIEQRHHIGKENLYRALARITSEEGPEPSPDNLGLYYRYWDRVSAKLANQFA